MPNMKFDKKKSVVSCTVLRRQFGEVTSHFT